MFVLPVIVYFLFLAVYFNRKKNIVESVVVSWLFVTLYTWLVVELSSLFGALSTVTVFLSWGAACAVFGVYALRNHVLRKTLTYFRTDYQISCILTEYKANLVCLLVFCSLIFICVKKPEPDRQFVSQTDKNPALDTEWKCGIFRYGGAGRNTVFQIGGIYERPNLSFKRA